MATATAPTTDSVTPEQIAQAKAAVDKAYQLAYEPQPVKQPDGTTIALCWQGRLSRAYAMASDAQAAGDDEQYKRVTEGIKVLGQAAERAVKTAEEAMASYVALCAASDGAEPVSKTMPVCTCEGCRHKLALEHYYKAFYECRRQTLQLLLSDDVDDPLPAIVGMNKTEVDAAIRELWASQRALAEAASQLGRKVDWHEVVQ